MHRLHHSLHRRMLAVLRLDPVLAATFSLAHRAQVHFPFAVSRSRSDDGWDGAAEPLDRMTARMGLAWEQPRARSLRCPSTASQAFSASGKVLNGEPLTLTAVLF